MFKKSLVICWRSLTETWHQKKLVAFLILYPLLFMIIFGSVFGGENFPIKFSLAIVIEEEDELAESFISIFNEQEVIEKLETYERTNESMMEQAKRLIDEDFIAVLFIPENFSKVMFSSVNLSVFYDMSADMNVQNIALGTINGIIEAFSKQIAEQKIEYAKKYISEKEAKYMQSIAQPINVSTSGVSPTKREVKYIDLLVPGLVGMTIMWSGVSGVASSLVEDRVTGIRQRILSTPTPKSAMLAGSTLAYIIICGAQVIILLAVAVFGFKLNIAGKLWMVALVIIIGMLAMIGIGVAISAFTKTAEEASQLAMLINFPMMFLSGIFFPISSGWMYYVSRVFPLTYINESLRAVMVKGAELQDIVLQLAISIIFTIAIFIIGIMLLTRREE
ncbi:MAG: ABC transporter permease [Thermoplasmata archaeon]|nr:MAG: ABC transporter permease [Thermoplasmata archaeon]